MQLRPLVRDNNRKLIVGWVLPDGARVTTDDEIVAALRANLPDSKGADRE